MPRSQQRLHMPYAEWPSGDRALWAIIAHESDPFSDNQRNQLAPASWKQYFFAWRRFLGYLALHEPSAINIPAPDRFIPTRIRAYVAHLAETNTPRSVAIQTDALYKAARHVLPHIDLDWFKLLKAKLHVAAPTTGKPRPILTSLQLLDLGEQLMKESQPHEDQRLSLAKAIKFRDGLMIALLAFVPLRRKNLAAIEIGRHLIREQANWYIVFPTTETKTGAAIEFEIPELLAPSLEIYLDTVRERLLRTNSTFLWASAKGGSLSYAAIWSVVSRHSQQRLGIRIAPHDVRSAAATLWALERPGIVRIASDLLSHVDQRTTAKYYNRADGIMASRTHAQLIARARKSNGELKRR